VPREFTVDEARALLASLRPLIDDLIQVRADAVELTLAVQPRQVSPLGGLPELKASQARLDELLSLIVSHDVQIKGIAPLLLDFPSTLDGRPVLLCWLEGDQDLRWYHRAELGFAGRRRLPH
jgi:hypothetical protein